MDPENTQPNSEAQPAPTQQSTEPVQSPAPEKEGSDIGSLMAIIIILLVIIAGGLYFWLSQDDGPSIEEATIQEEAMVEERPDAMAEIESEFNTEEFNDIEEDFDSIDAEFEGETQ